MKSILHIVNKSQDGEDALASCLRLAHPGNAILLIEDGVYHALADSNQADVMARWMENYSFFVLGPDLVARGLGDSTLVEGTRTVGYDGFVDLVAAYEVTQSW